MMIPARRAHVALRAALGLSIGVGIVGAVAA
jgi:hypothetical protein